VSSDEVDHRWLKKISGTRLVSSEIGSELIELKPMYEEREACLTEQRAQREKHASLKEELVEIRENLAALRDSEDEAALRKDLVARMRTSVEQLRALDLRQAAINQKVEELDAEIRRRLTALLGRE
jgi:hypothetical protein